MRTLRRAISLCIGIRAIRSMVATGMMVALSLWIWNGSAHAGTVIIVDGPDTEPSPGNHIYTDAFIQRQLNTVGSLTIDTDDSRIGLVDEIRIEPQAMISWTSASMLTLIADERIVVGGTIQHDGPDDGSGGITLLAGDDVLLGLGTQPELISVGSRHGLTRVSGSNVRLQGGDTDESLRAVILGFRAVDKGPTYRVTGSISVTAALSVTAAGGTGPFSYVQIGHGGAISDTNATVDGALSGNIAIVAGGNIRFAGGTGSGAFAQVGNGGYAVFGDHSGRHGMHADGNIVFSAGAGSSAYAQAGNGGYAAFGAHRGNHTLDAGNDILFSAGGGFAYVQAGNGGLSANGGNQGDHSLRAGGEIRFAAGAGSSAYAQAGNGGYASFGNHHGSSTFDAVGGIIFRGGAGSGAYAQAGNGGLSANGDNQGNHSLRAGGEIRFAAGAGSTAYVQAGNGGYASFGNHHGSHTLMAEGELVFTGGGNSAYAQFGNGGYVANGLHDGNLTLDAGGDILFQGGSDFAYAQAGNGGLAASGTDSGDLNLYAAGTLTLAVGNSIQAYAQIGHGDVSGLATGTYRGDIVLRMGEDLILYGAHIGHTNAQGQPSIAKGNTIVAVGQNNQSAQSSGRMIASHMRGSTVGFTSAAAPNGELRFYAPNAEQVTIDPDTPMNAAVYPGRVPADHVVGDFLFGDGPYVAEYAFYFSGQPDGGAAK